MTLTAAPNGQVMLIALLTKHARTENANVLMNACLEKKNAQARLNGSNAEIMTVTAAMNGLLSLAALLKRYARTEIACLLHCLCLLFAVPNLSARHGANA